MDNNNNQNNSSVNILADIYLAMFIGNMVDSFFNFFGRAWRLWRTRNQTPAILPVMQTRPSEAWPGWTEHYSR